MNIKNEDNDILKKDEHKIKYFILGIIIGFLLILIGVFIGNNNILMALGIMLTGTVIIIFPFCTPETVKLLGYKRSKSLGRILGVVLIVVGIWVWIA